MPRRSYSPARLRRESLAQDRIPYTAHVAPGVLHTRLGDYLQVFRLGGASFETADDDELNRRHERLNILWRNVASTQVVLWTHLLRRREDAYPASRPPAGFGAQLDARYRARLSGATLMVNELYLSVLYRPAPNVASHWAWRLFAQTSARSAGQELEHSLEACARLRGLLLAALAGYDIEALGLSDAAGPAPLPRSGLLEFLGTLINGESHPIAVPRAPINQVLCATRLLFGSEIIEYRMASGTRFGAMLAIREYPTPTRPGLLNGLLCAPFPLILTQSFAFLSKGAAQGLLQRQHHRLSNAGDFSRSQAEELGGALDALTSNVFVMGEHHFSLQVLSDSAAPAGAAGIRSQLHQLHERLAVARSLLADTGMAVAREDLALEGAFWAQLPGQLALRPRRAPITSRNFAALAPWHNFPAGRRDGNHWGEALTLLATSAQSPYYFSLHTGSAEGEGARDTGHTFICGPTGSGKTVLIGFLIAMLQKHGATQVIFDKDRGLEILVRALGGTYLPLRNGVPTGCNPLQLDGTAANVEFLQHWLRVLVRAAAPSGEAALSAKQQADLSQALDGTLALPRSARRLSRLIEFLDPTDPDGVCARLAPWCASGGGEYAWVFDNAADTLLATLVAGQTIGLDVTDFLGNASTRAPLTLYLFHLVRQLLDGRRLVCWLDEFWRMLSDPAFEHFAKDGPKTWRKLNAVMCFATQSPADVLASPLCRTIIEQTPTKILFPNPQAQAADYVQGLGLSLREWQVIGERLSPGAPTFLIRQGRHSVVCELNLKGFDPELAVISGRAASLAQLQRLLAAHGADPKDWLPPFQALYPSPPGATP